MTIDMDYDDFVKFVRKHAFPGELHDILRAPSRPYRYGQTTIHLTYFSMPDWLAVLSAAALHKNSAGDQAPIVDVLRSMALEGDASSVIDFMWLNSMTPADRDRTFRRLVLGYRTAAQQHQKSVEDCLKLFTRKGSGRALLTELGRTKRTITVVPHWLYFMALPDEGYSNASAAGIRGRQTFSHLTDGIDYDARDMLAKGVRVGRTVGTGKGADALVYFSAGAFTDVIYKDYNTGEPGNEPDEVLYHELCHVTRLLRGKETHAAVRGRGNFPNSEEYFATVITNIYLSEKGSQLIGKYSPDSQLHAMKGWSVMTNPSGFYGNNDHLSMAPSKLMDEFKRTQREFFHDLAILPTPPWFNPVKTHYRLTERIPV
jgi:hypothetical protein